jgi:hypothetical protein
VTVTNTVWLDMNCLNLSCVSGLALIFQASDPVRGRDVHHATSQRVVVSFNQDSKHASFDFG